MRNDVYNRFAHGNELDRASRRIFLNASASRPSIGVFVMTSVKEENYGALLVEDNSQIATDSRGPYVRIMRSVHSMCLQPRRLEIILELADRLPNEVRVSVARSRHRNPVGLNAGARLGTMDFSAAGCAGRDRNCWW
jgi:hypothetical protein